jgi:hypothetical protein
MATARSLIAGLTLALTAISCTDKGPTEANNTSDNQTPKAEFQNSSRQFGLVNVSLGNVDVLNNVNLAVAANVLATVCDLTIGVAALADQLIADGGQTDCTGNTGTITIDQALPGQNAASGPGGGNQSQQAGLVNVSVGDVAILNDVNAAVAANVLVTVCDVTAGVALVAVQGIGDTGQTFCTNTTNPVTITQSQG